MRLCQAILFLDPHNNSSTRKMLHLTQTNKETSFQEMTPAAASSQIQQTPTLCNVKAEQSMADPGATRPCPQSPGTGASCLLSPPQSSQKAFIFFESKFGSIQKNGGLNPWSFQFWGHTRLGPRAKLVPLKPTAGPASANSDNTRRGSSCARVVV